MMDDIVIKATGLKKVYRLWPQTFKGSVLAMTADLGRNGRLPETFSRILSRYVAFPEDRFTAINNFELEVRKGETVGIIGKNGAGKTTLLQILCGIIQPTSGTVEIKGRISALIALGAGFDPEFTGRENVYMNAALSGMSKSQMDAKFEEVVRFAEIGKFMDQPLKTYSSGMQIRLGFAVQTVLDPEILIIDEALSVGDETFQRKCFSRLEELRNHGVTLLFVSHNLQVVHNLCERVIFMDTGEKIMEGCPKSVVSRYQQFCHATTGRANEIRDELKAGEFNDIAQSGDLSMGNPPLNTPSLDYDPDLQSRSCIEYDSEGAHIDQIALLDDEGRRVNLCKRRQYYTYRYRVRFTADCKNVSFAMLLKTPEGQELGGHSTHHKKIDLVKAGAVFTVSFRFYCLLTPWTYFLNAGVEGIVDGKRAYPHRLLDAYAFRVHGERQLEMTGLVDFKIEAKFVEVESVVEV